MSECTWYKAAVVVWWWRNRTWVWKVSGLSPPVAKLPLRCIENGTIPTHCSPPAHFGDGYNTEVIFRCLQWWAVTVTSSSLSCYTVACSPRAPNSKTPKCNRTGFVLFCSSYLHLWWLCSLSVSYRFNFENKTPTTNFDTFPAAILTVFQVKRLPRIRLHFVRTEEYLFIYSDQITVGHMSCQGLLLQCCDHSSSHFLDLPPLCDEQIFSPVLLIDDLLVSSGLLSALLSPSDSDGWRLECRHVPWHWVPGRRSARHVLLHLLHRPDAVWKLYHFGTLFRCWFHVVIWDHLLQLFGQWPK